jgi:hypothetical protein
MTKNAHLFDENVPERLQRALLKLILENYKESSRYCYRYFSAAQAKDLSGTHRRARIEEDLLGIEGLFPSAKVLPQLYENATGHYNEVTSGLVKMTQSCITEPDSVPRLAKFRSTLASNGQFSLTFEEPETNADVPEEASEEFLYGILTHVVDSEAPKRSWPAFVRVQFPNETCTKYVDDGIDLMKRFPDIVAGYIPKQEFGGQRLTKRRRRREEGA